eukprot:s4628_g16.t1
MHGYLAHLEADPKTSASCGNSFLEAVRFSSAMLGLISEDEILVSKRVEGLAVMLVKRAPVIAQAIPLTVEQVKLLEKEGCEAESLQDRMICGGILIMIYGVARASDMAKAIKLVVDKDIREHGDKPEAEPDGYIELGVLQNKGARFTLPPREQQDGEDDVESEKSYEFPFSDNEDFTDSSSDDAASEGMAESIDDSTALWELLGPELRPKLVPVDAKLECYVHAVSCVVHLKKHEGQRFLCGRFQQVMDGAFQGPTIGLESMMRQLSYEAITVAVAAIRQRVEPQQEGQLKKLPPQERDERIRKQAEAITEFTIQGDYEPGHSVVYFFTTMLEECAPKYLPLSKCISREQELQTMKTDRRIVVLEDQQLQVKNKAPEAVADFSTDLKVQNAFVRRGLACEQAGIMTYATHEKIRHAFMAHLTRQAPSGFRSPDLAAVLRADRELWMKAFEKCKSNIRVDSTGKSPLGVALLELRTSPEVVFHLLPTPGHAPAKRARSP